MENILTSSLVIGYIYCNIAYFMPLSFSYKVDTVCIILSALFLGYAFAMIFKSKKIVKILDFLKIRDTGNLYFWDDLMDNDYPMKVRISYEKVIYEGMLHNYESYSNEPHVIMASYIAKDSENNIIDDFSNDNTKVIILNISKAMKVEILYYKDSGICKDLQSLCNFNKEI